MEIGTRVRFLNELGGGEIVKKLDARHYLVRTEDGFEFPMPASELVVDTPPEVLALTEKSSLEGSKKQVATSSAQTRPAPEPDVKRVPVQQKLLSPRKHAESLFLAFAPLDLHDITHGSYALYVLNESGEDVLITLSRFERRKTHTFFGGRVASYCGRKVCEINISELFLYSFLRVQALYYTIGEHELREPFLCDIEINPNDFTRPRSFRSNRFLEEDLLLIALRDDAKDRELEVLVEQKSTTITEKEEPKPAPRGVPAPEQIVVDLHIEALCGVEQPNMNATEKLQFQMQHFRRAMNESLQTPHLKRLIAIHGVGNGTLMREVQRVVRTEYKQCTYQDASFKEYGYGATLIVLGR